MNKQIKTSHHHSPVWDATPSRRHISRDNCLHLLHCRLGLRVSELCELKVIDVNPGAGEIYLRTTRSRGYESRELDNELTLAITHWLAHRYYWKRTKSPWLFISQKGEKLSRQQVYRLLAQYPQGPCQAEEALEDCARSSPSKLAHSRITARPGVAGMPLRATSGK